MLKKFTLSARLISIFLFMHVACFAVFAATTNRTIDRTIAKINDDILTESDLAEIIAGLSGQYTARDVHPFDLATSETITAMFDRSLLLQESKRLKISPPNEEIHRQVEEMVRNIKSNFASEKEFYAALADEHLSLDQLKVQLLKKTETDYKIFQVVNSRFSISDTELASYRAKRNVAGESVASYHLLRLGIPVKKYGGSQGACQKARELVGSIITEGISFEEGARKYSEVPSAAADGGDMGYMSADKLSNEVRSAVENLKVGQASVPIIAGGFANIFYMDGKRGAKSSLREKKFFDAREELLAELRHKAILQVFDPRLLELLPTEYSAALVNQPQMSGIGQSQNSSSSDRTARPAVPSGADSQYTPTPTPRPSLLHRWFGGRR